MLRIVTVLCAVFVFWLASLSDCRATPAQTVREGRLTNGLSYTIVQDITRRKQAEFYFIVRAGWLNETSRQVSYAHLMEHLLASDARHPDFPGVEGGPLFNLWQGQNSQASLAKTNLTQALVKIPIDLERARSVHPLGVFRSYFDFPYTEAAAQREGSAIINEGRKGGDLYFEMVDQAERAAPWMGYALSDVERSMQHISMKELKAFHGHWYRPARTHILVRGDVDANLVEREIKAIFSAVPPASERPPKILPVFPPKFSFALVRSDKLDTATVKFQFRENRKLAERHSLFDNARSARVAAKIITAHMSGLVQRYDATTRFAAASSYASPNGVGLELRIDAGCNPDRVEKCINEVMSALSDLALHPVSDSELLSGISLADADTSLGETRQGWGEGIAARLESIDRTEAVAETLTPEGIRNALKNLWANSFRRVEVRVPSSARVPEKKVIEQATSLSRKAHPFVRPVPRDPKMLAINIAPGLDRREVATVWRDFDSLDVAIVGAPGRFPITLAFAQSGKEDSGEIRVSARSARGLRALSLELQASGMQISELVALNGLGGMDRFEWSDYARENQVGYSIYSSPFSVFLTASSNETGSDSVNKVAQLLASMFRFELHPEVSAEFSRYWKPESFSQGLVPGATNDVGLALSKDAGNVTSAYRALIHNPADFVFEVSGLPKESRDDFANLLGTYLLNQTVSPAAPGPPLEGVPADIRVAGFNSVQVYIRWAVPERDGRDYDRVDQALTQILSARLLAKLRGDLEAAYGVGFGASNLSAPPLFTAVAQFDAIDARVDELVAATIAEFAMFAENGPTQAELAEIRQLPTLDRSRTAIEYYLQYRDFDRQPPAVVLEPSASALMERARLLTRGAAQVITTPTTS